MKAKKKLVVLLSILLILTLILLYDMNNGINKRFVKRFEIIEHERIPNSFNNISILYFSDLLSEDYYLDSMFEEVKDINVDLILFGGNLLKEPLKEEQYDHYLDLLSRLEAPLGKYAVYGEYDLEYNSYSLLEQAGFEFLSTGNSRIYNNSDYIELVNLDEKIESNDDVFQILLAHDAKLFENLDDQDFDLILTGKYLGGQIKLPFFEPLMDHPHYYEKRSDLKNKTIIHSKGLGYYDKSMRLGNNPEAIILILRKDD